MAIPTRRDFETLKERVYETLDAIRVNRLDVNPDRALWEIVGAFGAYEVHIKEIYSLTGRMYSYYVIRENEVIIGFDNYPDRQVLQQKFGKESKKHLFELVPHKHGRGKATLELTEELSLFKFLAYLREQIV